MPPLSHILRFYTSSAKLTIEATPDDQYYTAWHTPVPKENTLHRALIPGTDDCLFHVSLDPAWPGLGREAEFIYVSRSFDPPSDSSMGAHSEILNLMLIEPVFEGSNVMRKVTSAGPVDAGGGWMRGWKDTRPVWKCIALA